MAGVAAGCTLRPPRSHTVDIRSFTFTPTEVAVFAGDTVVWSNADFVPHTATARDAGWDSKSIGASGTWRFVARTAGRHEYYCAFHPNMQAVIVVR
jgi:plastocyanin